MDALKSWKTTVAGMAGLAMVAAFLMGRMDAQQLLAALGVVLSGGMIASKDAGAK